MSFDDAYASAYDFLYKNLPSYDVTNAASLGFHSSSIPDTDGLEDGVATLALNVSLEALQSYEWAKGVEQEVRAASYISLTNPTPSFSNKSDPRRSLMNTSRLTQT